MRELSGEHAQHFPDTDTLDIQKVQLRGHSQEGQHVTAVADQALAKGDGTQVTLVGNVHISQPASTSPAGPRAATVDGSI